MSGNETRVITGYGFVGEVEGTSSTNFNSIFGRDTVLLYRNLVEASDGVGVFATTIIRTDPSANNFSTNTNYTVTATTYGLEGPQVETLDLTSYVTADETRLSDSSIVSDVVPSSDGTALFSYLADDGITLEVRTISEDLQTVSDAIVVGTISDEIAPNPIILAHPNSGYTVIWTDRATGDEISSGGVYARQLDANGMPIGDAETLLTLSEGLGVLRDAQILDNGSIVFTFLTSFNLISTVLFDDGVVTQIDLSADRSGSIHLHEDGFYLLQGLSLIHI